MILACCSVVSIKIDNVIADSAPVFNTPSISPVVDEKAKEEEAYRQIKIKMRAEQLLAESDLPASMKRHAIHYTGTFPWKHHDLINVTLY